MDSICKSKAKIALLIIVLYKTVAYLQPAWQYLEYFLLLHVNEEGFAVLLDSSDNAWVPWVPCQEQECILFEFCC